MSKYRSLRGMPDILPDESVVYRWIEEKARQIFDIFEFHEIRTPVLEDTEVFTRSIGEDTDIVEKEMYTFVERGGKTVSLRPEGTASIIRAYIEHGWHADKDIAKLFYIGPMFRGERPQKGRLRQFHQIGAEIIGGSDPYLDAELIVNLKYVLESLGVTKYQILLNCLGCAGDRDSYKNDLKKYLEDNRDRLCDNCKRRYGTNVLRVLDCKNPGCANLVKKGPLIKDHLCAECGQDHEELKELLKGLGIKFKIQPQLVRGLDYYTGTVFEVVHKALGAQDSIAAGGRYDRLSGQMGGPEAGATGYAIGVERLILALGRRNIPSREAGVLVIAADEDSRREAFRTVIDLRAAGITCDMDFTGRSLKGCLRRANREGRKRVVIIGEQERSKGEVVFKDMENGEQRCLSSDDLVAILGGR